jgi:hypothetical protein
MLAMEPILLLVSFFRLSKSRNIVLMSLSKVTLYMGFIYGFLYLCFEAYPIAFQELRGWNAGVGALPFAAIIVGVAFGCMFIAYFTKTRFAWRCSARRKNDSYDCRWCFVAHRHVLVRMDQQPEYHLGAASHFGSFHWCWSAACLLAGAELHYRCKCRVTKTRCANTNSDIGL